VPNDFQKEDIRNIQVLDLLYKDIIFKMMIAWHCKISSDKRFTILAYFFLVSSIMKQVVLFLSLTQRAHSQSSTPWQKIYTSSLLETTDVCSLALLLLLLQTYCFGIILLFVCIVIVLLLSVLIVEKLSDMPDSF